MPDEFTILIVDDEPDLCEMLMFEFTAKGYRALAAAGRPASLELSRFTACRRRNFRHQDASYRWL